MRLTTKKTVCAFINLARGQTPPRPSGWGAASFLSGFWFHTSDAVAKWPSSKQKALCQTEGAFENTESFLPAFLPGRCASRTRASVFPPQGRQPVRPGPLPLLPAPRPQAAAGGCPGRRGSMDGACEVRATSSPNPSSIVKRYPHFVLEQGSLLPRATENEGVRV